MFHFKARAPWTVIHWIESMVVKSSPAFILKFPLLLNSAKNRCVTRVDLVCISVAEHLHAFHKSLASILTVTKVLPDCPSSGCHPW